MSAAVGLHRRDRLTPPPAAGSGLPHYGRVPVVQVTPEVPEVYGYLDVLTDGGEPLGRVYSSPCCGLASFAATWRVEYAARRDGWIRMGCGDGQVRRRDGGCPTRFLAHV